MSNCAHVTDHNDDNQRIHQEQAIDALEEQVPGRRIDQVRHEDDDEIARAFEQDLDDVSPKRDRGLSRREPDCAQDQGPRTPSGDARSRGEGVT